MAELGARKDSKLKAIGTAPSINKTPIGGGTPPVAYPVQHDLSNSENAAATVRFNGQAAYKLDATYQGKTQGDDLGTAGGVKSGTVNGLIKPTSGSGTIRIEGYPLVRVGDSCTLNSGNCPGIFVAQSAPSGSIADGKATVNTDPPVKLTPAQQEAWYQKLWHWAQNKGTEMGAAVQQPGQGAIGALKNIGNLPADMWNLLATGATAQAGADIQQSTVMASAFGSMTPTDAAAQSALAQQMMTNPGASAPTVSEPFEMSNPAQRGGSTLLDIAAMFTGAGEGKAAITGLKEVGATEKVLATGEKVMAGAERDVAGDAGRELVEHPKPLGDKPPETLEDPESPGDGAKIQPKEKLPEKKVPCFHPYDKPGFKKLSPAEQREYLREYAKQLRGQQDAINGLTANEFQAARDAYTAVGRNPVADGMQEAAREDFINQVRKSIGRSLMASGMDPADALAESASRADSVASSLAALHEPDMVAGGWANPDPTRMGSSNINSSIGASWNQGGRLGGMDEMAEDAIKNGKGSALMNVKLEPCRGKGMR